MSTIKSNDQSYIPVIMQYLNSKETFDSVVACKEDFINNIDFDLVKYPNINPLILKSWIRSRNFKVDLYVDKLSNVQINDAFIKAKKEKHGPLIETALPLITAFKEIAISSSYNIGLIDSDDICILHQGKLNTTSTTLNPKVGSNWKEGVIGTNAHSLCKKYKKPVQLIGPLQYCFLYKEIIGYAAPILGEDGEILATINLAQPMPMEPWDTKFQELCSHTLGLIIVMALAIETKLKLKNSYDQLYCTHKRLESTLAIVDEGIITIDRNGRVLNINKEGCRILNYMESDLAEKNVNICDFLNDPSNLMSLVASGTNGNIEDSITIDSRIDNYLINVNIVQSKSTDEINSAVLRLNHIDKINSLANSRVGTVPRYLFEDLIGESQEFLKAIRLAKNFAHSPENILLIGESGTGKELFAQAIHNASRPNGPFIALNCAAIPRNLIESELFGYEKGSFTGADRNGRPGKIELANGGTLFLDEIGDMPIELQAMLLRVLQDKQVIRIGGQHSKSVDFRLIAATNKKLLEMVETNFFRGDLFFRLSVLSIEIPPLRQRGKDIQSLSEYFLNNYCRKMLIHKRLSNETLKILMTYDWPGNVRQLENAIIYAINTSNEELIKPDNIPAAIISALPENITIEGDPTEIKKLENKNSMKFYEKQAIQEALAKTNNVSEAAELLNIGKSTLYKKLKKYNITPK